MLRYHRDGRGSGQSLLVLCLSVIAAVFCFPCPLARAQGDGEAEAAATAESNPYEPLPVDETLKRDRPTTILDAPQFGPGEQDTFSNYYRRYGLPRWTQPANLNSLPKLRNELRNELMRANSGTVHDFLNNLAMDVLSKMAQANVHPAARYNAMLMIGDLNAREPAVGQDPVPLADAVPILLAALGDPKQIDAVKMAALIGLARHAELGIPDEDARQQVLAAALGMATAKSAPGRSADGQAWMRVRAIQTLGFLGASGDDGTVAKALATIVAQPADPMSVRCAAAAALGRLDYSQAAGLNPVEMASQLGQLALAACREQLPRMKAELEKLLRETREPQRGIGAMGRDRSPLIDAGEGRRFGARLGEEPEEQERICRRVLKAALADVKQGLVGAEDRPGGVASLAKEPEQRNFVSAVTAPIDKWLGLLDDKKLDDEEMLKGIEESLNAFGNLLQQAPK